LCKAVQNTGAESLAQNHWRKFYVNCRLCTKSGNATGVDGNARPIFLRGRVFALLGYELVDGKLLMAGYPNCPG
jgi:hypothetical protein